MDQWIAWALLVSSLMLLQVKKLRDCVPLLAFQSIVLTLLATFMWYKTGLIHLLIAAVLTLVVKAMVIPVILHYTIGRIGIHQEVERMSSKYVSLLVALILSVLGYYVTSRLDLPIKEFGKPYLPISIILIFLGTYMMIDHKKALMQGVGLIIIENGLFLVAQSMSYGMPMMVELGIFFDLLVTVIIVGILSFRIHSTFDSLNTEKMQNLKG